MSNSLLSDLKLHSKKLLSKELHYGEMLQTVKEFKYVVSENVAFDENFSEAQTDLSTNSGKAIATKWAGLCIEDFLRTYQFCNGVYEAANQIIKKQGNVHILYAGTGPFATLVLPLTQLISSDKLKLTLLEINPHSFELLQKTIANFGLKDYVTTIEQCDATSYTIQNPEDIDILLSETMMHSLKDEHQVAISFNLMSQLNENTILIPEQITLDLLAVNQDTYNENKNSLAVPQPYFKNLGTLFQLDKEMILKHKDHFRKKFPNVCFEPKELSIPKRIHKGYHSLCVATFIKIFGANELKIDDSGLTVLQRIIDLNPLMQTVSSFEATYCCGEFPGLELSMKQ